MEITCLSFSTSSIAHLPQSRISLGSSAGADPTCANQNFIKALNTTTTTTTTTTNTVEYTDNTFSIPKIVGLVFIHVQRLKLLI